MAGPEPSRLAPNATGKGKRPAAAAAAAADDTSGAVSAAKRAKATSASEGAVASRGSQDTDGKGKQGNKKPTQADIECKIRDIKCDGKDAATSTDKLKGIMEHYVFSFKAPGPRERREDRDAEAALHMLAEKYQKHRDAMEELVYLERTMAEKTNKEIAGKAQTYVAQVAQSLQKGQKKKAEAFLEKQSQGTPSDLNDTKKKQIEYVQGLLDERRLHASPNDFKSVAEMVQRLRERTRDFSETTKIIVTKDEIAYALPLIDVDGPRGAELRAIAEEHTKGTRTSETDAYLLLCEWTANGRRFERDRAALSDMWGTLVHDSYPNWRLAGYLLEHVRKRAQGMRTCMRRKDKEHGAKRERLEEAQKQRSLAERLRVHAEVAEMLLFLHSDPLRGKEEDELCELAQAKKDLFAWMGEHQDQDLETAAYEEQVRLPLEARRMAAAHNSLCTAFEEKYAGTAKKLGRFVDELDVEAVVAMVKEEHVVVEVED